MGQVRAIRKVNGKSGSSRRYRKFPLERIALMWSAKKTIAQIARAIGRFDEKYPTRSLHAVRDCLRRMHKGYVDARGRLVKLPHRVSPATVRACRKAGFSAA
jgi:hypothetical protein